MLPLDWINLWVLGPAIGFGAFLTLTFIFVLARSRFRNPPNISFLIFVVFMLAASVSLVILTHQIVFQQTAELSYQFVAGQAFTLFAILTLTASLAYYIFIEIEVSSSIHWLRLLIITASASILLAALTDVGFLQFFPLNLNTGASGFISAAYLLAAGFFLSAAIYYFRLGHKKFGFFGIVPLILLIGLSLNTLFIGSILIASISIGVIYLLLATSAIFEGMIKPSDIRIQEVESLNAELIDAYFTTLEGWARALELRDKEIEGHSRRVTTLAVDLAEALGLSEKEQLVVRFGALLHDIGKMAIPDEILKKPGKLTPEERKIIEEHPQEGYNLLKDINYLESPAQIALYHHEKWDGSGYPEGLSGADIPFSARLFAIVDVWDAITSNRPYAAAWPIPMARAYLQEEKGISFDPDIVDTFLKLVQTH